MVVLIKNNVRMEASSWADACRRNGYVGAGMNKSACQRYLEKNGFTWEEEESTATTTVAAKRKSLIETIIEKTKTVDVESVKSAQKERELLLLNLGATATSEDIEKITALTIKINNLQNPKATLEDVLAYVEKLFKAYEEEQKAEAEAEAKAKAEAEAKPEEEQKTEEVKKTE
jgi:hypothetical protein